MQEFLKKKYQEKLENAYLTVKNVTASGALSKGLADLGVPRGPGPP